MPRRAALAALLLCLLLTACSQPAAPTEPAGPGPAPPTPQPTATESPATPTAAPSPAATAAPEPTATPPPSGELLPAPLYVLDEDGQIWRMERDGATRRQVTYDPRPILAFDLRLPTNGLVYQTAAVPGDAGDERIVVALDGAGRTELVQLPVGAPLARPGSDEIYFALLQPVEGLVIGEERGGSGIWGTTRAGGRPFAFQLDTPSTDPVAPPDTLVSYNPLSWSPDGARLLMGVYPGFGEGVTLTLRRADDRSDVEIRAGCCEVGWSADGQTMALAGGLSVMDSLPGLWRVDPATGAATELLPGQIDSRYVMTLAPHPTDDGGALVFMTLATEPPELNPAALGPLVMTRVAPDGTRTALRPNDSLRIDAALWAPDGSGAVVSAQGALFWLAADGAPPAQLAGRGTTMRWGAPDAQPDPAACDMFRPLGWQPPAARQPDGSVADVQARLAALGASIDEVDGLYGDATRDAVAAFQQQRGLQATGDVDCATWQALYMP